MNFKEDQDFKKSKFYSKRQSVEERLDKKNSSNIFPEIIPNKLSLSLSPEKLEDSNSKIYKIAKNYEKEVRLGKFIDDE